ncbi:Rho GTPase-activating protein 19, partial [Fasciola gigantica]
AHLNNYADWLAQSEPESSLVKEFRETWPQRFVELCKFHLSVLIDMPSDFFEETSDPERLSHTPPRPVEVFGDTVVAIAPANHRAPVKRPTKPWQLFRHVPLNDPDSGRSVNGHRQTRQQQSATGTNLMVGDQILRNIMLVMDALDTPEHLSIEGIFRKTGNVVRQRLLRQRIASDKFSNVDSLLNYTEPKPWRPAGRNTISKNFGTRRGRNITRNDSNASASQVNVHDLASGLKGVLYELPEPILSSRLLPLFAQVAALTAGRIDDRGNRVQLRPVEERIAGAKQLKALRLLCLLLPDTHCRLFQRLLRLLERTLDYSGSNRMTAESLGTLFGPLLLSPGKVHTRDLHNQYNSFARLATIMIEQGVTGLWMVPRSFSQDIERNYRHLQTALQCRDNPATNHVQACSQLTDNLMRTASDDSGLGWNEVSQPSSDTESCVVPYKHESHASTELPALVTCIHFAVRPRQDKTNSAQSLHSSDCSPSLGETEYAVAELCAAVQAMPDTDPRKRRLIQRFNATNGGLTPASSDHARRAFVVRPHWPKNKQNRTPSPSPVSAPFARANTGNSAFKAAKTIRSSLRRRLAMKSTVSIASCFEHHLFDKPIPERNEQTHLVESEKENRTPLADLESIQTCGSPIFDCPTLPVHDLTSLTNLHLSPMIRDPGAYILQQTSSARFSLMSTASVASLGAGGSNDLFFCCPLVEALASPFRRRVGTGYQQTPDSVRSHITNSNSATPVGRILRTAGKKRLRCMSPPLSGCNLSVCRREDYSFSRNDRRGAQTYYPIAPPGTLSQTELLKRSKTFRVDSTPPIQTPRSSHRKLSRLCRMTTQTNLLAYGYRTMSHVPRPRSACTHVTPVRRSETMPCVKSEHKLDKARSELRPCESLTVLPTQFDDA